MINFKFEPPVTIHQTPVKSEPALSDMDTSFSNFKQSEKQKTSLALDGRPNSESLFDNKAELKISLSQIAMHLSKSERDFFHSEIDALLDPEAFLDGDKLITVGSLQNFLRFYFHFKYTRPGLSVSPRGNLTASWIEQNQKLHIEFLINGNAHSVASRSKSGEVEYLSHAGNFDALANFLSRNELEPT